MTAASSIVLVVDDERLMRWALAAALHARSGCRIVEAGTADAARASLAVAPDLVLLDVRLPDGSGLDVLRQMRVATPDTPVILMTAYDEITSAAQAMRLGAWDLLLKPFDIDHAARLAARGLEASRLRRAARARPSSG